MAAVAGTRSSRRCDGVDRFDGQTWTRFLWNHCVYSLEFGDDGSVWLLAVDRDPETRPLPRLELYVIRPEVAMAQG